MTSDGKIIHMRLYGICKVLEGITTAAFRKC